MSGFAEPLFFQQPHEKCFLGMKPVFRLVPYEALAPFHHFIGNLLTAVRRQAVQDPGIG
jgi:hypothetical protein